MATAAELQSFASKTSFDIPTIDYQVGASALLTSFKSAKGNVQSGVFYDANTHVLHVKADGATLSGYNFSGVTVSVEANNVTIQNSKFDASNGVYALTQANGKSGLVVDHNSFDGLKLNKSYADFINGGDGKITITYNSFLNVPSDSIQLKHGVVDHNYFSGTGYQAGAHADAIAIDGTTGPISITNNFIDSRNAPDARAGSTSAIAIGNSFGDNQDITVSKNVLLGGAYTVYVHDFGVHKYGVVDVEQNFVAAGQFGDLYPNGRPAALVYADNVATNVTSTLLAPVTAVPGLHVSGKAGLFNEVLHGADSGDWLYGHGNNDVLVGGGGRDFPLRRQGRGHLQVREGQRLLRQGAGPHQWLRRPHRQAEPARRRHAGAALMARRDGLQRAGRGGPRGFLRVVLLHRGRSQRGQDRGFPCGDRRRPSFHGR